MASFESSVASRAPAGTKVSVFPRVGDWFAPNDAVKSTSVSSDGSVNFTGLKDNAPYWYAWETKTGWQRVAFTAKSDEFRNADPIARRSVTATADQTRAERVAAAELAHESRDPLANSPAPGRTVTPNVITGARSSTDLKRRHQPELVEQMENRKVNEPEPQPGPNQMDVKGVPQRSDTPFGQATPKDPNELQPRPTQSDVKANVAQRSSTEFGEATPKERDEVEPAVKQQDSKKGLQQRSDTELGEVTPKAVQSKPKSKRARVKASVEAQKREDSSVAKATGESPSKSSPKPSSPIKKKKR